MRENNDSKKVDIIKVAFNNIGNIVIFLLIFLLLISSNTTKIIE